jgi:hypothetical protein
MKNVRFTLVFALSMLFLGAGTTKAYDLKPEKPAKPYDSTQWAIRTDLKVLASAAFLNTPGLWSPSTQANNQGVIWGKETRTYNGTGIAAEYTASTAYFYGGAAGIYGYDLRAYDFDSKKSSYTTVTKHYKAILDDLKKIKTVKEAHVGTIKLLYDEGQELKPFVRRKVYGAEWKYDAILDSNVWAPNGIVISDQLLPVSVYDKLNFAEGGGTAVYKFESEYYSLTEKYRIWAIEYTVWTNYEFGPNFSGGSFANPVLNRALKITADPEINLGDLYREQIYRVSSSKDYKFPIIVEDGKEPFVVVSREDGADKYGHAVPKATVVPVPGEDGLWQITLFEVNTDILIDITLNDTNGVGGGDDTNNEALGGADAVWSTGGALYVKAATPSTLAIYNVTGQLYKQIPVSGSYTLSLAKGIYIVKLNNKAYKVVL